MVADEMNRRTSKAGTIILHRQGTFQNDPFLLGLTTEGARWWGKAATDTLVVAAVLRKQAPTWAAYYEDPYWGPERVATLGNKLP